MYFLNLDWLHDWCVMFITFRYCLWSSSYTAIFQIIQKGSLGSSASYSKGPGLRREVGNPFRPLLRP